MHGCGLKLLDRASNLFSGVYAIVKIDGIVHTLNTLPEIPLFRNRRNCSYGPRRVPDAIPATQWPW